MNRLRILTVVGLAAMLAAAVWCEIVRTAGEHPQSATAASPSRPIVASDRSTANGASLPHGSAINVDRIGQPIQIFPAESAPLKSKASPVGMERVGLILNSTGSASFADRVRAIRTLSTKLTSTEIDAFARYLRTPTGNAQNSDEENQENWLRNQMLDALAQQADVPPGPANLLVAVYQDRTQDPVMRDYAVQYMAAVFGQVSVEGQTNLGNALWQATGETDSSIAGTALLALLTISKTNPTVDTGRLADTAVNLATDDQTGELARITAVQVCGRLAAQQALRVIEQLTQQSPSMPLRIAATAALGDYAMSGAGPASTEAANLLTQLVESSDPRLALAAQTAFGRIVKQARR